MAELTLPKNSKILKGKDYPLEDECKNKKGFSIYRWSPCLLYTSDAADDLL